MIRVAFKPSNWEIFRLLVYFVIVGMAASWDPTIVRELVALSFEVLLLSAVFVSLGLGSWWCWHALPVIPQAYWRASSEDGGAC